MLSALKGIMIANTSNYVDASSTKHCLECYSGRKIILANCGEEIARGLVKVVMSGKIGAIYSVFKIGEVDIDDIFAKLDGRYVDFHVEEVD